MRLDRLEEILEDGRKTRILVVGDFFLDLYWSVDPDLEEISIETGKPAHQIVARRPAAGAAGTIVNNLAARGVESLEVVGLVGEDPSGWELQRLLEGLGTDTSGLIVTPDRLTPVYIKPMFLTNPGECEGERFDIKNRKPLPAPVEERIAEACESRFVETDAVVVLDQVQEAECGTITGHVRETIKRLAAADSAKPVLADSRCRIGRFRDVMIKPNLAEAAAALRVAQREPEVVSARLHDQVGRAVFLTLGADGLLLHGAEGPRVLRAIPVSEPIDPVGAGDSMSAGIISALAVGATEMEAAQVGLLSAAVTIRKVGTTGTASPAEILEVASEYRDFVTRW
jgi:rfaE bifunctional protein kinase chain/domain